MTIPLGRIPNGTDGARGTPPPIALLMIAVALSVGCADLDSPVDVEPSSLWEAVISPSGLQPGSTLPLVSGQAAVVVRSGASRVGLGLVEGVDQTLAWGIFEDSCAAAGPLLLDPDAYPAIPAGTTELETTLPAALSENRSYHVRIMLESGETVACGNFAQVSV